MPREIIKGLKDLIEDRESFITPDEPDDIFVHDKKVLEEAIKTIEAQQQEIGQLKLRTEAQSLLMAGMAEDEHTYQYQIEKLNLQNGGLLEDITHLHTIVIPEYEGVLKKARDIIEDLMETSDSPAWQMIGEEVIRDIEAILETDSNEDMCNQCEYQDTGTCITGIAESNVMCKKVR